MSADGGQSPNRRGKRVIVNNNSSVFENVDEDTSGAEASETVLWERFEGVAFSITKLYRAPTWPVFQQAAAKATEFYKDSVDAHRRGFDSGVVLGRQLLCKELLSWLQSSSHPYARRDEVVNVLLGRTSTSNVQTVHPPTTRTVSTNMDVGAHLNNTSSDSNELEIFQEALNSPPDLTAFFVEECRRHAKRRFDDDNSGGDVWGKKRSRRT